MTRIVSIMAVAGLLSIGILSAWEVSAQVRHPVSMQTAVDSSAQKAAAERELKEEHGVADKEHWEAKGSSCEATGYSGADWRHSPMAAGMMFHGMKHSRLIPALFILACMTAMLLVNIVLTILVSLDMAQRHAFVGLWVPVLLLVGVPGTALYALFRIGDLIRSASEKKA
jgi:hypothetical protein